MKIFILRVKVALYSLLGFITGKSSFRNKKLLAGTLLLVSLGAILSCNHHRKTTCYSVQVDPNTTKDTIVGLNGDTTTISPNNVDTMPEIMCYKSTVPKDQ